MEWRERMTNWGGIIPSCPLCGNRLFTIYVGGIKEKIDGEMWCKVCKKPMKVEVKISIDYPEVSDK